MAHCGEQKALEASTMVNFMENSGFRCFFDRDMKTIGGAPAKQMRFALETCRYCVAFVSKNFLEREHPCNELKYAFQRMEWIRKQQSYRWESLFIVLFDLSVDEFTDKWDALMENDCDLQLSDIKIGRRVNFIEWQHGSFPTWVHMCSEIVEQMKGQDETKGAAVYWSIFLRENLGEFGRRSRGITGPHSFPCAVWL